VATWPGVRGFCFTISSVQKLGKNNITIKNYVVCVDINMSKTESTEVLYYYLHECDNKNETTKKINTQPFILGSWWGSGYLYKCLAYHGRCWMSAVRRYK